MSYLARLSARLAEPRANAPLVHPKGVPNRPVATVSRVEESGREDETASPMRPLVARHLARQTEDDGEEVTRQTPESEPEEEQVAASRKIAARTTRRQTEETPEEEVAPLRRQDAEEEEPVAPLRRQEDDGDESVAPLRRQPGEDEEADVAPLRRQAAEEEEPVAPLRRQEDDGEEPVAPLRRQAAEDEETEVAPLRRQVSEARPMRAIAHRDAVPLEDTGRTVPPRTQAELEPDAEPPSEELAGEREPSDLQALHRDIRSGPAPSPPGPVAPGEPSESRGVEGPATGTPATGMPATGTIAPPHSQLAHLAGGIPIPPAEFQSAPTEDPRPSVTIDQLDVLIHEPAAPAERTTAPRNRDRALRARYLRRL